MQFNEIKIIHYSKFFESEEKNKKLIKYSLDVSYEIKKFDHFGLFHWLIYNLCVLEHPSLSEGMLLTVWRNEPLSHTAGCSSLVVFAATNLLPQLMPLTHSLACSRLAFTFVPR